MIKKLIFYIIIFYINLSEAELLPKFDWSKFLNCPPGANVNEGSQILHFKSKDKHYTQDEKAFIFVSNHLSGAKIMSSDAEVLRFASDSVKIKDGFFIELGVCTGKSINFISALNPSKVIYGFDSFEGLPEDWDKKDFKIKKGTFAYKDKDFVPPVLHNVALYKGWFKDSLPEFVSHILKKKPIAFLHIDSVLYSSAKEALTIFRNNIVPDTIIVFDEFYNYQSFEEHEKKAFEEFLAENAFDAKYIAFNQNHQQVAVIIMRKQ